MTENELSHQIIGAAIAIHEKLGPGLFESVCESALAYDLMQLGRDVKVQFPVPLIYKEVKMDVGFRLDLLVDSKVIVEVKSVEILAPVHSAQLLTYLKLTDLRLGLLINFNVVKLRDGIHRVVNRL